ncbi:CARDB domain-containing protein, partial [Crocosphaera sp.]|uniref:CARDB domain-containing protein n=1 Tax=Crocosphaera sp. TaxID=2729996 RepID=UPI003F20AE29
TQTQQITIPSNLTSTQGYLLVKTDDPRFFNSITQRETDETDNVTAFSFGQPLVFVNDIEVLESANQAIFDVFLSQDYSEDVTVSYTLNDGTAISGQDYQTITDTITFAPGETSKNIIVSLLNENRVELNETFTLNLTNAINSTLFDEQATATIINDDQIQLSNNSVDENTEDGTIIGIVSATDENDPSPFTFSLINDAGGRFILVDNQLQVSNGSLLDYENDNSHQITVRATDEDGNNFDRSIEIAVNDLKPDLYISNIAVVNNQLTVGENINITWTITNQGNENTDNTWIDYIYLSKDNNINTTADNIRYEYQHLSNLLKLDSVDQQLTIPISSDLNGDYNLIIVTDGTNQVTEDNENNNIQSYSQKITITNPQPNLQVTNINAANELFLGQETEIEWTISNIGDGATANQTWGERIWLSLDNEIQSDQDIVLGTVNNLNNLISNDGYNNRLAVTIPDNIAIGNYYLIVETDYENRIEESVETDNIQATIVQIKEVPPEPKPDLQVSNIQASNRAIAGYDINVSYDVTNSGSVATSVNNWTDSIYLSTDQNFDVNEDILIGNYEHNGILEQNQSYSVDNINVELPNNIDGDFYVFVTTDINNQVDEDIFESNNSNYDDEGITIYATLLPDLEIELTAPTKVRAGEILTVNYQIQNNGLAATPNQNWSQRFYLSQEENLDINSSILLGTTTYQGVIEQSNSVDLTFNKILDYNLEGFYYIHGVVDNSNTVVEIFEDNNTNIAANFLEIVSTPPDLVVSNVIIPNNAEAGENINLQWTVSNQGNGDSFVNSWVDGVYLQDSSGNNRLLNSFTHEGLLNTNEFYTQSQTVTIPNNIEGDYSIYVVTDFNNQVFEKDKENNNKSELQSINIIRNLPDLVVSNLNLSQETDIDSGTTITVTWEVTNQGEKATTINNWIDNVYLRDELGNETLLKTVNHRGNLMINDSYSVSTEVELDVTLNGNYEIFVVTDGFNGVEEDDKENNNTSEIKPINIIRKTPDLVTIIINAPSQVQANKSVLISWEVTNQGTRDSLVNRWVDRVYLVDELGNKTFLKSFTNNRLLNPDQSYIRQESVQIPFDFIGNYNFLVETDSLNQVYEAETDNNNQSELHPTNIIRNTADLQVTNVTFNPNRLEFGDTISVNWEVRNNGDAATNANFWYDSVYLSLDSDYSEDDIYIGRFLNSNLLKNGLSYQATAEFNIPAIAIDNYHIIVRTDSSNNVFEPNLDDNNDGSSSNQVIINSNTQITTNLRRLDDPNNPNGDIPLSPEFTPDLVVTTVSINETEILTNQSLEITWTVENQRYTAGNQVWYDTIYVSPEAEFNPDNAIAIGSRLGSGDTYTKTDSFLLPYDLEGNYYVHVVTDSNNRIIEGEAEDNNSNSTPSPLQITAIDNPNLLDLVVENITFNQTQVNVENDFTINYTVSNQGQEITGSWVDAVYLSTDNQWDVNDILLGKVNHNGGVAAQGNYSKSLTTKIPGLSIGDYYVIVRSDIQNQIPEADELNNRNTSNNQVKIDVPILEIGNPVIGKLSENQRIYYRFDVEAGEILSINFDSNLTEGFNELYISYEDVPTRGDFDFGYNQPFEVDQEIVLNNTLGGTYYLLAYGNDVNNSNASYTLSADSLDFSLRDIGTITGSNKGLVTIPLTGAKFTPNTIASLIAEDGSELNAEQLIWQNNSEIWAQFDLQGLDIGLYDVQVSDGNKISLIADSFNIIDAEAGQLEVEIEAPEVLLQGTQGTVTFKYFNAGYTDITAPILDFSLEQGSTLPAYYRDGNTQSLVGNFSDNNYRSLPGVITGEVHSLPAIFDVKNIQSLPYQSPFGVLRPGETKEFTFTFGHDPDVNEVIHRITSPASGQTIDWDSFKDDIKPAYISAEAWDVIFDNFIAQVGNTTDSLEAALAKSAAYFSRIGDNSYDVEELIAFELQKASNNFVDSSLATSIDALAKTPGITLAMGRNFRNSIEGRFNIGGFGRGWFHPWEVNIITDSDDNVIIQDAERVRFFTLQNNGSYRGENNDSETLTKNNNGYILEDVTGTIINFNLDGSFQSFSEPNGNSITATYTNNQLTRLTHSNGDFFTLNYNSQGRIRQVIDQTGEITNYTYDSAGEHLLSVTNDQGTISYTYNNETRTAKQHALTSITYPDNTNSYYEYDDFGRMTQQSLDNGNETVDYIYDSNAGVTVTDADGNSSKVLYNARGQIAKITDQLGRIYQFDYDSNGNLIATTNPDDTTSLFRYDSKGNITRSLNPLGNQIRFSYDSRFDFLEQLTDQKGNRLTYNYDELGNTRNITYADGSSEVFDYDQQGNLILSENRRQQTIEYSYNAQGLVTEKLYTDGTKATFSYDERGNLLTAIDSDSSVAYEYDQSDRLTKVTYDSERFLTFNYDSAGRRTQMRDHNGFEVNYSYDNVGRLKTLTNENEQLIVSYTYDNIGRLQREDNGNGTYTTYNYDIAGQLQNLVNYAPDGTVNSRFDYTYDLNGRRSSMTTLEGKTNYTYDAIGQLTSVTLPDGRTINYTYDAAGNRIAVEDNGITTGYSTNNLNQYQTVGNAVYEYDDDGNLISKTENNKTITYNYDSENRLIEVMSPEGIWTYEYDALGNRIATIHNGERTEYLLDPTGIVNVVGEYDNNGLVANYVHGLGLVSQVNNSSANYYDADAIGSTIGLSDVNGNYLNTYSYLPFGEDLTKKEAISNPFEYVGQWGVMDESNGLDFMRARFYDTVDGRFTSLDPIGLAGGDTNFYAYSANSPVIAVDPWGTAWWIPATAAAGAIIGAGVGAAGYIVSSGIKDIASGGGVSGTLGGLLGATTSGALYGGVVGATGGLALPGVTTTVGVAGMAGVGAATNGIGYGIETAIDGGFSANGLDQALTIGALTGPIPWFMPGKKINWLVGRPNKYIKPLLKGLNVRGKSLWEALARTGIAGINANVIYEDAKDLLSEFITLIINAFDPNDILGPEGFGEENWIPGDEPLNYTIRFENLDTATAPAREVRIVQQLDADLDFRSFRLGDFGFADFVFDVPENQPYYQTRLDLTETDGVYVDVFAGIDVNTKEIFWELTAIDPETGEIPTDPLTGFLPPNLDGTEGQGFVTYTLNAIANVPTGTVIDAAATIFFDNNEPIDTPPIFNTIDNGEPTSTVDPLPTVSNHPEILVQWTGTEEEGGSAIASYSVYVSENGQPFTPWLENTTLTEAIYLGEMGNTYEFYSITIDNVGNPQETPTEAQVSVTLATLDIDRNGILELQDYNLIDLYASGLDESEFDFLINNFSNDLIGENAIDDLADSTWRYINEVAYPLFDIDGNGQLEVQDYNLIDVYASQLDPLEVGFLIENYSNDLIGDNATRADADSILAYFETIVPETV